MDASCWAPASLPLSLSLKSGAQATSVCIACQNVRELCPSTNRTYKKKEWRLAIGCGFCCLQLEASYLQLSFLLTVVGPTSTQNLVVKFDGGICSGILVEHASDCFFQQKKLENHLPNFAGNSPPVSPKLSPTSLWKSLVLTVVLWASLLTALAFLPTILAFDYSWSFFAYNGKVRLIGTAVDCKQRSSTVSRKAPTVSKKASPLAIGHGIMQPLARAKITPWHETNTYH